MKRGPAILCVVLLLSAAIVLALRTEGSADGTERVAREAGSAKATGPRHRTESANAALLREIRALTIREIRDQLPEGADYTIFRGGDALSSQRARLILERFGAMEGEAALDELLTRYGAGGFSAQAMALAIAGWMETDQEAALAALRDMTSASGTGFSLSILNWKGANLISGVG